MILDLSSISNLLNKFSKDYTHSNLIGKSCIAYTVIGTDEDQSIESTARLAFLKSLNNPIIKQAFDTRKINQETERNPRGNLQFYHRTDPFISEEDQNKINLFSKLTQPLNEIKQSFGSTPEYLNSYARVLLEAVDNVLRVKDGQLDIFRPQMEYLSQILFLRYRLSNEDLEQKTPGELKKIILAKDETLLKRGLMPLPNLTTSASQITKTTNINSPENLVQALFQPNLRLNGEKTVERTITITIKDSVLDES